MSFMFGPYLVTDFDSFFFALWYTLLAALFWPLQVAWELGWIDCSEVMCP